jgi:hypothetical protein
MAYYLLVGQQRLCPFVLMNVGKWLSNLTKCAETEIRSIWLKQYGVVFCRRVISDAEKTRCKSELKSIMESRNFKPKSSSDPYRKEISSQAIQQPNFFFLLQSAVELTQNLKSKIYLKFL